MPAAAALVETLCRMQQRPLRRAEEGGCAPPTRSPPSVALAPPSEARGLAPGARFTALLVVANLYLKHIRHI